jgi:putative ATPase
MIYAGEDPRFIARRLIILAAEDIGNADPFSLVLANSCFSAVEYIGMPEARIVLSEAVIYLALAPKSNASYEAIEKALDDIKENKVEEVPEHLKMKTALQKKVVPQKDEYKNPHYEDTGGQKYMLSQRRYYMPKDIGRESKIHQFLKHKSMRQI